MTSSEAPPLISTDSDLPLKLLTKVLFAHLGYVAEIAVEIPVKSYANNYKRSIYSDYDVLAIRFEPDLRLQRIAAECKSGDAKAVEEVFKLLGVLSTFGIERGYFIKSRLSQIARELAVKSRISALTTEELEELLRTSYGTDPKAALASESVAHSALRTLDARFNNESKRAWQYLRFEFWNREPHRNVQGIISLLTGDEEKLRPEEAADRFGFLRLLFYFSLALLELCGRVIGSGLSDPKRTFGVLLFGGPRERREREVLFDAIHQAIPGPESSRLEFEPAYVDDLNELMLRFVRSAPEAAKIPAYIQAVIDEKFAKLPDRVAPYGSVTRKLAQDAALFLIRAANLSKSIGDELLSY